YTAIRILLLFMNRPVIRIYPRWLIQSKSIVCPQIYYYHIWFPFFKIIFLKGSKLFVSLALHRPADLFVILRHNTDKVIQAGTVYPPSAFRQNPKICIKMIRYTDRIMIL